jgi:hypothetical protein
MRAIVLLTEKETRLCAWRVVFLVRDDDVIGRDLLVDIIEELTDVCRCRRGKSTMSSSVDTEEAMVIKYP